MIWKEPAFPHTSGKAGSSSIGLFAEVDDVAVHLIEAGPCRPVQWCCLVVLYDGVDDLRGGISGDGDAECPFPFFERRVGSCLDSRFQLGAHRVLSGGDAFHVLLVGSHRAAPPLTALWQ